MPTPDTTPAALMGLAAKVEGLSGPCVETNKDILEATGGCAHRETKYYCIEDGNDTDSGFTCLRCREDTYGEKVPNYTASLDAAMTLVPEQPWRLAAMSYYPSISFQSRNGWFVNLSNDVPPFPERWRCVEPVVVYAATPALALTAACLRALSHSAEQGGEG